MKRTIKRILHHSLGEEKTRRLINALLFKRENFSEAILIYEYFSKKNQKGMMVDVGAHIGQSLKPYLQMDWTVIAFEPDPANRETLSKSIPRNINMTVLPYAVSDKEIDQAPFFASTESTGISSLTPFTISHKQVCRVKVVTLKGILAENGIHQVDFLKIDAEGQDLPVLRGFPWESVRPEVILCEFEDLKTKPIGYDYRDLGDFMVQHGYAVFLSEWKPIVKYGGHHKWLRLTEYPSHTRTPRAWGNFIAVSSESARSHFTNCLKRFSKSSIPRQPGTGNEDPFLASGQPK